MVMFYVIFEDGTEATEAELGDWDHVPKDSRLKEVGLYIPAFGWGVPPLPLRLKDKERYYCARLNTMPLGGVGKRIGYVLVGKKNGAMERITCDYRGIDFDTPDPEVLNIREETWRNGIKPSKKDDIPQSEIKGTT
jgi:hypothetical protein